MSKAHQKGPKYETRLPQVQALIEQGLNGKQIAAALGISYCATNNFIKKARDRGDLPPAREPRVQWKQVGTGSVRDALKRQSYEFQTWVARQAERNKVDAVDVIVSAALDQYYEETESACPAE